MIAQPARDRRRVARARLRQIVELPAAPRHGAPGDDQLAQQRQARRAAKIVAAERRALEQIEQPRREREHARRRLGHERQQRLVTMGHVREHQEAQVDHQQREVRAVLHVLAPEDQRDDLERHHRGGEQDQQLGGHVLARL